MLSCLNREVGVVAHLAVSTESRGRILYLACSMAQAQIKHKLLTPDEIYISFSLHPA